ncbi:hypothetical protein MRB53_007386 [Persea americana]|uniref:Uncharacterized protein n=1 Tax=Persea americana TaxID=3435 RepID=A0ACC2MJ18_PERAE|nr:hypothetical protein MRB53_007386 [Persea americana]
MNSGRGMRVANLFGVVEIPKTTTVDDTRGTPPLPEINTVVICCWSPSSTPTGTEGVHSGNFSLVSEEEDHRSPLPRKTIREVGKTQGRGTEENGKEPTSVSG